MLKVTRNGTEIGSRRLTFTPTAEGLRAQASVPREDGGTVKGAAAGNQVRTTDLPVTILPTSQWRRALVERDKVFNTQSGKVSSIRVERLGAADVATECGTLPATHCRLSGDMKLEIWFDDRDRWVKTRFVAPDGSVDDYTLRCPAAGPSTASR